MNIEALLYSNRFRIRTCATLTHLLGERLKTSMTSLDALFDEANQALATITVLVSGQIVEPRAVDSKYVPALALDAITRIDTYLMRLDVAGDEIDDRDLREASRLLTRLQVTFMNQMAWRSRDHETQTPAASRRTRWAAGLAVRLLPPADRARYREEFASELADLPCLDQAPYAFRLIGRAWSLRRSLTGSTRPVGALIVVAACTGSSSYLAVIGWPAAALGGAAITALMWTVSNSERTFRMASLIRAARSDLGPQAKKK